MAACCFCCLYIMAMVQTSFWLTGRCVKMILQDNLGCSYAGLQMTTVPCNVHALVQFRFMPLLQLTLYCNYCLNSLHSLQTIFSSYLLLFIQKWSAYSNDNQVSSGNVDGPDIFNRLFKSVLIVDFRFQSRREVYDDKPNVWVITHVHPIDNHMCIRHSYIRCLYNGPPRGYFWAIDCQLNWLDLV